MNDRQQECGSLAGTRLGGGYNIPASNNRGYHLLLYRSSLIVAHVFYAIEQVIIKTKVGEIQYKSILL